MPSIGIDYSASKAYLAAVRDRKVVHIDSISLATDQENEFLGVYQNFLRDMYSHYGIEKIFIEQSWSREGKYAWTGVKMEHMKTLLQVGALLSRAASFEVKLLLPQTWRKAIFGKGNPPDAKDYAVEWVQQNLNFVVPVQGKTGRGSKPDHNFAEAICLALCES